ncbi:hypothetical protein DUNSADRAFT_6929 [Dunaliella salina]|uniref:Uncharacterized protein n=1 Tax=Dunaliella salina TaxID=3046 RepID=A0ABQ7GMA9_DUNSA|nr:hypothetical protein DUNSADRAFT_6929 [Dunaliella salina]|eukprot:KAF5835748.1 hypothetical protein DUNSADRAFT_6929 [Dunaliella salina]
MQAQQQCCRKQGRFAECVHRPAPYRQRVRPRTACLQPQDADLAGAFSSFLLQSGQAGQRPPVTPSPLMPPHSVVAAQMEALQRNDYPETDAGLQTAYRFSKPYGSESLVVGQVPSSFSRVRSWGAAEEWLTPKEFASMLNSPPYNPMVGCESWRAASGIVFTSTRHNNKAVQAVHVTAAPTLYPPFSGASSLRRDDHQFPGASSLKRDDHSRDCSPGDGIAGSASPSAQGSTQNKWVDDDFFGGSGQGGIDLTGGLPGGSNASGRYGVRRGGSGKPRVHTFTFCLERVDEGALKGIWYTVGVRVGDYTV